MSICWLNGDLLPVENAKISVMDHGLLYGDGVFEGIRFYHQQAFRLQTHLKRLFDSARAIQLDIPYSLSQLEKAVDDIIQASSDEAGYLRLIVTRGVGPLGINPEQCAAGSVIIIAASSSFVSERVLNEGARLIIATTRRISPDCLDPRIKSLNYLNHILARQEANAVKADEAILLNSRGHVTEGSTDNIFIVKNHCLLTPPVTDGALEGVTRGVILELAEKLGLAHRIQTLSPYDLYNADECFLTGTAMELIPVNEIDGRRLKHCSGEMFNTLSMAFKNQIDQETLAPELKRASS